MSHTPGPWRYLKNKGGGYSIFDGGDYQIGYAANVLAKVNIEDDARIIAAAPDMEEWIECTIDHLKMLPNTELIIASGQKLLKRFNIVTIDIDDE